MKKQAKFINWCMGVTFFLLASLACKKSTVTPDTCETVGQKAEAFTNAAQAYVSDPANTTKCQAYKNAAADYVNAADKCSTVPQSQINAAKDAINSLTCN